MRRYFIWLFFLCVFTLQIQAQPVVGENVINFTGTWDGSGYEDPNDDTRVGGSLTVTVEYLADQWGGLKAKVNFSGSRTWMSYVEWNHIGQGVWPTSYGTGNSYQTVDYANRDGLQVLVRFHWAQNDHVVAFEIPWGGIPEPDPCGEVNFPIAVDNQTSKAKLYGLYLGSVEGDLLKSFTVSPYSRYTSTFHIEEACEPVLLVDLSEGADFEIVDQEIPEAPDPPDPIELPEPVPQPQEDLEYGDMDWEGSEAPAVDETPGEAGEKIRKTIFEVEKAEAERDDEEKGLLEKILEKLNELTDLGNLFPDKMEGHNWEGDANSYKSQGEAAGSNAQVPQPDIGPQTVNLDSNWPTVTVQGFGTIDFNPFVAYPPISTMAQVCRLFLTFIFGVTLIRHCNDCIERHVIGLSNVTAAKAQVSVENVVPGVSQAKALLVASLTVAALLAFVAAVWLVVASELGAATGNTILGLFTHDYFGSLSGLSFAVIDLMNRFFPLVVFIKTILIAVAFQMLVSPLYIFTAAGIRFLVI